MDNPLTTHLGNLGIAFGGLATTLGALAALTAGTTAGAYLATAAGIAAGMASVVNGQGNRYSHDGQP